LTVFNVREFEYVPSEFGRKLQIEKSAHSVKERELGVLYYLHGNYGEP
jgi:hypothetical protein